MDPDIIFERISPAELRLSEVEVASRLKTKKGYTDDVIEACRARLEGVLDCRFSAVKVSVCYPAENIIDLGFGEFKSVSLYDNLDSAPQAYIFAVTIGLGADRLILKLAGTSPSEHFITDALASAYAEAAAERADELLRARAKSMGLVCRRRYSPGYGDMPLSLQPDVLRMVNAGRLLGITLSDSLLMSPKKSITAVMGLKLPQGEQEA